MKMGHIRVAIATVTLFLTTQTLSMSFSDTMQPLKDAIANGQSLPMTELPLINMVSLPADVKKALDNIEILAPVYTFDAGKQVAMVEGGAMLFGQPVMIKLIMGRGSLGAAAKEPIFLKQVQDGKKTVQLDEKVNEKDLQALAKDARTETEGADAAAKKGELPTDAMVNDKVVIGGHRELLQEMAPQKEVNLPVLQAGQVVQETQTTGNKIKELSKKAGELVQKGAGKAKATLTSAFKSELAKLKISFMIALPSFQTWSTIDKNLAFLDIVKFSNVMFVATTADYYDAEWNRSFRQGFNILGTARLSGPLEKINGIIGQNLTEVTLQGVIKPDLFGSSLLAELPGKIKFNQYVESSGLMLRLLLVQAAFPISVSILTGLNIRVPNQEQPLAFRTGLTLVPPTEFIVGGWMEGMWNNPFGLPYFSIGEIGLQAGMDINTAAASLGILALSRLGLRGQMGFADKKVEMASSISLSSASPDIMLHGKFTGGLYLNDVLVVSATMVEEFAKQAGKPVSIKNEVTNKVPNLGLKNAEIYIAPKDVDLAGKYYRQGIIVGGVVDILGVTGELRIEINKSSVQGLAYMSNIDVGPFKLSGAGKDKKIGTADDGPILNFTVKSGAPFVELFLDARAELDKRILGGAYGDTRVNFSMKGIEFWIKTKIFNEFLTHLELSAPEFAKPKDWKVIGRLEQEALTDFANLLQKGIEEVAKSSDRDIAQAQQNLNNAKAKLQALKPDRDALDNQIRKCKGQSTIKATPQQPQVQAAIDKKAQALQGPELTAQDINKQIDALRKQGVSQAQLDRIAHNMWARIARRELNKSRDITGAFRSNPALLNSLDPTTQAAVKAALAQESSSKMDNLVSIVEGQIEWTLSKLRNTGLPAQSADAIREQVWKNELKDRYYKQYIDSILKFPAIDSQERALEGYANNIRRMDWYRKTGLTPQAVETRINNFKDLVREAIFASELLTKKIGAGNVDGYIDKRWTPTVRKDLEKKLPQQPAKK